jgi:hypothetical protein
LTSINIGNGILKKIIFITILFLPVIVNAQEYLTSPVSGLDTMKFSVPALYEPDLSFSGSFSELTLTGLRSPLNIPAFDFSDILKEKWQIDYSITRFAYFPSGYFLFPYPGTGMVFNQASWKASPKLTVGGSSFGFSSPFHAPLPGAGPGQYPSRGMNVFMEYKIGKNFRIGGGVTVSGHQP